MGVTEGPGEASRVLLHCLRDYFGASSAADDGPLDDSIDWAEVARLARSERVEPLLLHALDGGVGREIPHTVRAGLRQRAHRIAFANHQLTDELLRLLDALAAEDVEAVPLKGPAMTEGLYGSLGLRPFGDLDLLVRPGQLRKAGEVFQSRGYASQIDWASRRGRLLARSRGYHHEYKSAGGARLVEVHWRLMPKKLAFWLDTEEFWQRLTTTSVAGKPVPALAPEDLLLYLCGHGAKHGWGQLRLICDISALVRTHPDLDWDALSRRARAAGAQRILHLGLRVTRDLLGVELPQPLQDAIYADEASHRLAEQVYQILFRDIDVLRGHPAGWRFNLHLRERVQDRAWYALGMVFQKS